MTPPRTAGPDGRPEARENGPNSTRGPWGKAAALRIGSFFGDALFESVKRKRTVSGPICDLFEAEESWKSEISPCPSNWVFDAAESWRKEKRPFSIPSAARSS